LGIYPKKTGNKINVAQNKVFWHSWAPVAHTCNPSYSGGIDQEDCGLKPAQTNSSMRPYLKKRKKTFTEKGLAEWLKE
jgi:hypothetical protein